MFGVTLIAQLRFLKILFKARLILNVISLILWFSIISYFNEGFNFKKSDVHKTNNIIIFILFFSNILILFK